jgi:aspartate aminotransferase-like enzyme
MTAEGELLLTPGPTRVPPRVARRIGGPVVHHRTAEFRSLWERVNRRLAELFVTQHPVLTLASSGTGALEATVQNCLSAGDTVIAAVAGKWGERYRDIAHAWGMRTVEVRAEAGRAVDPEDVRRALEGAPEARAVLVALCETSTGVLNPVREIAAAVRGTRALLMVDAVSGLGCDPLYLDAWEVDVAVGASQKGLMLPPGLGFVALGPRALRAAAASDLPKFYFDFLKHLGSWKRSDSAFTPAVTLVQGLDESLAMIVEEEGVEAVWARHRAVAESVREALAKLGFGILAERPSGALTAAVLPEGADAGALIRAVRERGVVLAGGQGALQGKIFRFAHMGDTARPEEARRGLEAVEAAWGPLRAGAPEPAAAKGEAP